MQTTILMRLVAASVLVTSSGLVVWAQHGGHESPSLPVPSAPVARVGKTKGKILEFSNTTITVETARKGRSQKATYLISRDTKTKGDLSVSTEVVVKFREEQGNKVATSIEAQRQKRPGA